MLFHPIGYLCCTLMQVAGNGVFNPAPANFDANGFPIDGEDTGSRVNTQMPISLSRCLHSLAFNPQWPTQATTATPC